MKTVAKRLLSLALGLCLAVAGVFTIAPTVTASAADGIWTLVKDVNDLAVEDQVIIVAKTANVAISTTQNTNNRGQANITKTGDTATISANVQIMTLKAGTVEGTFAFYTGSKGYLYAASSSKNYLKSQTTNNANGSWNITIAATGVATIKAQGTNTRNWMRYNSQSSLFACYGSGQNDICIYKLVTDTAEPIVSVSGAEYGQVGDDINLTANLTNIEDGTVVTWTSSNESVALVDEDGVVTAVSIGKTTITATAGETKGVKEITVYPVANSELTIAEAIALCKITNTTETPYSYSTTGTIKSIDEAYSTKYKNITLTITDGTNSLKIYRLKNGQELKVGNTIKVTGKLINYGGNTPEYNSGCTYVKLTTVNDINAYMQLAYKYTEDVVNEEVVLKDSDFRLNCGIDSTIADVEGATSYGIRVTANGKTKDYTSETATSWAEKGGKFYVVLSLGDIVNDVEKLCTEFTVEAFAVIDGEVVVSKNAKKYSVATMVAAYQQAGEEVEHLYNYLVEKGLIVVEEVA